MFLSYVLEVRAQEQSALANVDLHRNPRKDVKQPFTCKEDPGVFVILVR